MMRYEDQAYHRAREQQCRLMAELANDPDVRRRHEELAELHAGQAIRLAGTSAQMSAA